MKRKVRSILTTVLLAALFVFTSAVVFAQENTNTASGQMKASSKEVSKAGKSKGTNVKQGRVVKGSKHFGKHMGKAGKHFGKSTKKAVKKIISKVQENVSARGLVLWPSARQ